MQMLRATEVVGGWESVRLLVNGVDALCASVSSAASAAEFLPPPCSPRRSTPVFFGSLFLLAYFACDTCQMALPLLCRASRGAPISGFAQVARLRGRSLSHPFGYLPPDSEGGGGGTR